MSNLADIEAKRAARKEALAKQQAEQYAVDLEAVDALECEHGDSNIAVISVPFSPGLVTLCVARCPSTVEMKRYRDRVKGKRDGQGGDPVQAAEELAAVCRVYPDGEAYKALLDARPGLHVQLGVAAIKLATGNEVEAGKG